MTGRASQSPAEAFANAAEALEGCRFRLHGRDPERGLDCVGVVLCALRAAGRTVPHVAGYGLRNADIGRFLTLFDQAGLAPATEHSQRGDMLIMRPGPGQHHCLIALGGERFVHAHAGIGRVIVQQGLPGWSLLHRWRLVASD